MVKYIINSIIDWSFIMSIGAFDNLYLTIKLIANFLKKHTKTRIVVLIFSAFLFIVFGIFLIISISSNSFDDVLFPISILGTLISFILLFSSLLAFSNTDIPLGNPLSIELKNLSQERAKIIEKTSTKPMQNSAFNTIQLNLNQTTEYYVINKNQAKSSFGISVFAMIAGLITILVGIWLFYFKSNLSFEVAIITTASGILLEIISGLYFHVYNKSIDQLNYFYEKLEKMQDTMLSIELSNNIEDSTKRTELHEKIILNLIERSNTSSSQSS